MHKVKTFHTTQGWVAVVTYDDRIQHTTEAFAVQHHAAQAGFRWIAEWMHSRISDRNAIELP